MNLQEGPMPANQSLFSVTSLLLKIATWFCWFIVAVLTLALGAVVVGLGVVMVAPAVLAQLDIPPELHDVPMLPLLGAALFAVAGGLICMIFVLLAVRATAGIVDTAVAGDPFIGENAERLKRIGWCLLGVMVVQFLTMMAVVMIVPDNLPEGVNISGGSEPDPVGLLAVLLVFVLARIFKHGTRMRDELEGTV
jgi:hypothetical protein